MKIWESLGKKKLDKALMIGMSMLTSFSTQEDAAHAVISAATALEYDKKDIDYMKEIYQRSGYDMI